MKHNEYSTARPTLKRWINRNPTVEPWWVRPKTEDRAPTYLIEILHVSVSKNNYSHGTVTEGLNVSVSKNNYSHGTVTESLNVSESNNNYSHGTVTESLNVSESKNNYSYGTVTESLKVSVSKNNYSYGTEVWTYQWARTITHVALWNHLTGTLSTTENKIL